jgi:hypothetical protein
VFLVLGAWVIAGLCVWVSAARAKRLATFDAETREAEGIERASRARLLAKLPESTRFGAIARTAFAADSKALGLALLNEEIAEIGRELSVGAEIPKGAARAAALAGGCIGIIELIGAMPEASAGLPRAAAALIGGIVGAMVVVAFGQAAETSARRIRDRANGLSRAVGRLLEVPESPPDSKENGGSESMV